MVDELRANMQVDVDRDKIKRAVKEALDDKAIQDLAAQMTALSTQMSEGFTEVRTRQDVANGKLMKHEYAIEDLKKIEKIAESRTTFWQRNQDKIVWTGIGVGLMLFYWLLTKNGFPKFFIH